MMNNVEMRAAGTALRAVCGRLREAPLPRRLSFIALLGLWFVASRLPGAVVINYWLWDNDQRLVYEAAARVFEVQNPDIKIKISQAQWFDYWLGLTTALVSDTAPDVFVNHLSRYPELAINHALLDLAPLIARDRVDPQMYLGNVFTLWGRDGKQYGLPKDWDVIGVFYNRAALTRAGIDPRELDDIDWNPRDGGGFGRMLARLTFDRAGENALSPRFDRTQVVQHGLLISGHPDGFGQTEWSHFAVSAGFSFYDGPWARHLRYDDPVLAETFGWLRHAAQREQWIIPAQHARQIRAEGHFAARRGALALGGSWMTRWYVANCGFEIGIAPLPVGPKGRKTMMNSLADSICATTRHPEEAWRWVKFLGSREGQLIVAERGTVFPAIREAAERAAAVMNARGVDVSAFLRQATAPNGTFGYPIVEHGSDLVFLTRAAMDRIFLGDANIATVLKELNREVNALFDQPD